MRGAGRTAGPVAEARGRRSRRRSPRAGGRRRAPPRSARLPASRGFFGLLGRAQRPWNHEADARTRRVDRAGLVVDQPTPLATGNEPHLVDVVVLAALGGDQPQVAGVAQARPVALEDLLRLLERLDHHDCPVELARAHQAAPEHVLDVPAQAGADVADDLDALGGLDPELLYHAAVAVVSGGLGHGNLPQIMTCGADGPPSPPK